MKKSVAISVFVVGVSAFLAPSIGEAQAPAPSLRGIVTDPSGALVPGAVVELRGPGGAQRRTTNGAGEYAFPALANGAYAVRVTAKGFAVFQRQNLDVTQPVVLNLQLTIESAAQVVNVEDGGGKVAVNTDPSSNGGALVLGQKELAALSDDPDELAQQLQAMAGPGAGPEGGQIYIDGFTGGNLPPKSSIREIRINSNPFSAEYDRTGFGRIEIFTKPGTDALHGQVFFQFNDQYLNSRSPLYTQSSSLPPYKNQFEGFNLSGPVNKDKASFTLDFERRDITENAFILATNLNSNLVPQTVNQGLLTPQTRTSITPRLDYAINAKNTLAVRYQYVQIGTNNDGVGSFNLASTAYNQKTTESTLQATETAVLSSRLINESRFQYMRTTSADSGAGSSPLLSVEDAFTSGGATVGNSNNHTNKLELSNVTTYTRGTHMWKWGARLRQSFNDDVSMNNFNGTFTFLGGQGEALDANGQPIAGTSVALTALQVYQRTLLLQQEGFSAAASARRAGRILLFAQRGYSGCARFPIRRRRLCERRLENQTEFDFELRPALGRSDEY